MVAAETTPFMVGPEPTACMAALARTRYMVGRGNDYVRVGGGAESFYGGSGTDYISYYDSSNGITIDLQSNSVSGSWAVNDVISSFESASGSRTGADKMYGTSGANTLRGNGGNDSLWGRSGRRQVVRRIRQ